MGEFVDELGRPDGEQAQLSVMFDLQRKPQGLQALHHKIGSRQSSKAVTNLDQNSREDWNYIVVHRL